MPLISPTRRQLPGQLLGAWWLVALLVCSTSGCVSWRSVSPLSASVASGRRLTQQGISAMEMGQWDKAEGLFRDALDKCPNDADAQHQLAETLWQRGETNEALKHMTAAALLAPDEAATAVRTGEMLLSAGRTEEAVTQGEQAVQLNHRDAKAWALRGRAYAALGNDQRALADFSQALRLSPADSEVLLDSAALYSRRGKHERCLATLHRLLDSVPPGSEPQQALLLEGKTYLALGRAHQASDSLRLASQRGPVTAELLALQARSELACGRNAPAEQLARQALVLDGQHQPAQQILVRLGALISPAMPTGPTGPLTR